MNINNDSAESIYANLGYTREQESNRVDESGLGQADFLELMTAQMNNQDPTAPMENTEFLSQMAQFSTVKGITELQTAFGSLAGSLTSNQSLQASSMVGQKALIPASTAQLVEGEPVRGGVELPASTTGLSVSFSNGLGEVVRRLELGIQGEGMTDFEWDGLDADGNPLPPGSYQVTADAMIDGSAQSLETLVEGRIESVTLGAANGSGLQFNVAGQRGIGFSDIVQLRSR
ncbi:MAG: flagellar hook assembly protein FlgD [Gammaproteobacteria bacterium]|nr:flagellar hook assembly protein FlgD [Gammaproteobacteria bacterium]